MEAENNSELEKDWNFNDIIDRRNTCSMKWENEVLRFKFGKREKNLLPLWVADMDFHCPTAVKKAMEERINHGIYGYTIPDPAYYEAVVSWFSRRHHWKIDPDWIITTPGVVPATNYLIRRFSKPGDKILIQSPVYYPFAESIIKNGRIVQDNPLKIVNDRYEMNFDDLKQKVKDPRVKMAVLCSPHNPVGRVWSRAELENFGNICLENGVLVFADEIHCDLIMPGHTHTSFQSISNDFAENSIAANAASKTFNLAGLNHSALVIPNEHLRNDMSIFMETLGQGPKGSGSLFGSIAAKAAYNEAESWLDDLIIYLYDNFLYLKDRLENQLPGVFVYDLEGTYLPWVNFNPLGHSPEEVVRIMEEEACIALDHGDWFGKNGAGYERFNVACPRGILEKATDAVIKEFKDRLIIL